MKDKIKSITWILLASLLIAAFFLMGGCSKNIENPEELDQAPPLSTSSALDEKGQETLDDIMTPEGSSEKDAPKTKPEKPETIVEKKQTCEIAITCEILASNLDLLPSGKRELIPPNGVILALTEESFEKGESVFDILARTTKNNKIHMEFVKTPIYNSAYIEGIHNIYELDGGEASGWMYSVNGRFPQGGASTYIVEPNDRIHWVYSCDLGKDVSGDFVNQKDD